MIRAALALCCVLAGLATGCASAPPCTPGDVVMPAHLAECRLRMHACGADTDCRNAVLAECEAWGEARCK